jgi:hypothetical protein
MADPLEAACSLVGLFLYHFARVEQKIDRAVIKLLNLDEKTAPVVALLGFATKVDDLVRASVYKELQNPEKKQEKKFAKDVCNRVLIINEYRRIVAHASFEPASGGGVVFSRPVTEEGSVSPVTDPWTEEKFTTLYEQMTALEADLDKLFELIKPVPFDWFMAWESPHVVGRTPLPLRE